MAVTAKVKCTNKTEQGNGSWALAFFADYADGRNKEWADATPSLYLTMTVKPDKGELFELGTAYTLTFEADQPAEVESASEPAPELPQPVSHD